jgi:hypothetical protein
MKPTAQEVFDQVVTHLRQQGKQSLLTGVMADEASCAYHSADGLKCAVGYLITKEEYDPRIEATNVANVMDIIPSFKERYSEHSELLSSLQRIHDLQHPTEWEEMFSWCAKQYKLTYTAP